MLVPYEKKDINNDFSFYGLDFNVVYVSTVWCIKS
jgi:hypothetical protein